MQISVAMAVYNGERFLEEQLDSILPQLNEDDELIISYDHSEDNTWELLQNYQAKCVQIQVYKNKNPGVNGNFNNAISHCNGDYIFICDQDDRWAENKKACVLETFEKSGADVVIHNGVHIDCEGNIISDPFFSMYRIGNGKIRNILKTRYSGCCMAFRKTLAKEILPIPAKMDAYDRWIGIVGEFVGKIAYDERILLYHRLHDSNVTPRGSRSTMKIVTTRVQLVWKLTRRLWHKRK